MIFLKKEFARPKMRDLMFSVMQLHNMRTNPTKTSGAASTQAQDVPRIAYNIAETALMLGIDRTTLWRLDKRGLLCPSKAMRKPRYTMKSIMDFLEGTK